MYRNDQQLHFVRRSYVHVRAVTTSHQDHKVLLIALASAIVGLWIACLPALTDSILTRLNVVVQRVRRPPRRSIVCIRGIGLPL